MDLQPITGFEILTNVNKDLSTHQVTCLLYLLVPDSWLILRSKRSDEEDSRKTETRNSPTILSKDMANCCETWKAKRQRFEPTRRQKNSGRLKCLWGKYKRWGDGLPTSRAGHFNFLLHWQRRRALNVQVSLLWRLPICTAAPAAMRDLLNSHFFYSL